MKKYLLLTLLLTACGGMNNEPEQEQMTSRFIIPVADVGGGINPSDGALLYFYEPGTNDFKGTFANETGSVDNPNPVPANANGIFPEIWLSGDYKVVLRNKDGDLIDEWDPVRERVIDGTVTDHIDVIDGSASNPSIGYINHPDDGFYHDGTSIRVKYGATDLPVGTQPDPWVINEVATAQDFALATGDDGTHFILTGPGTYNITINSNSSTPFDDAPRVKFSIKNLTDDTIVNILNGVNVEFDRPYQLTRDFDYVEMYWSSNLSGLADRWTGFANIDRSEAITNYAVSNYIQTIQTTDATNSTDISSLNLNEWVTLSGTGSNGVTRRVMTVLDTVGRPVQWASLNIDLGQNIAGASVGDLIELRVLARAGGASPTFEILSFRGNKTTGENNVSAATSAIIPLDSAVNEFNLYIISKIAGVDTALDEGDLVLVQLGI